MTVPFLAFADRFAADRELTKRLVAEAAASGAFILKQHAERLETEIRRLTGASYAIAVSNATNGLTLALHALGVGPGVDVLTPAFSFISSATCIALTGARPVFVDVDPRSATLSLDDLPRRLTKNTRAVLPVHLFSSLADMTAIRDFARSHDLKIVEDSAVALGARIDGRPVGRLGHVGVFSFFPAKPMGGPGDAGIIVTDEPGLAKHCRMLRNHGQDGIHRFVHHHLGFNHRMDEITAGFLCEKLKRTDAILARRKQLGDRYSEIFRRVGIEPVLSDHPERVYYNYVIRSPRRDALRAHLKAKGIETRVQFPPLHLQPAFAALGHRPGDFPGAERLFAEVLCLPLYPEMTDEQHAFVAESVEAFHA
jgi:dTDP-4-amino-4,6-dideoxygalactose transaminase